MSAIASKPLPDTSSATSKATLRVAMEPSPGQADCDSFGDTLTSGSGVLALTESSYSVIRFVGQPVGQALSIFDLHPDRGETRHNKQPNRSPS